MNYDFFDIANYIVEYSTKIGAKTTHIKLQGLLYLVSEELAYKDKSVSFNEEFVEWKMGPILEGVYKQFSHNRGQEIKTIEDNIIRFGFSDGAIFNKKYKYNSNRINEDDKSLIEKIVLENKEELSWSLMSRVKELYKKKI